MPLESVHNVKRRDCFPLGVFCVGDGVADDALEEGLQHASRLLVDHGRDSLDAATTRQPPDGRLRDALDVVAQNLPVPLGAALASKALATFAACIEAEDASVIQ